MSPTRPGVATRPSEQRLKSKIYQSHVIRRIISGSEVCNKCGAPLVLDENWQVYYANLVCKSCRSEEGKREYWKSGRLLKSTKAPFLAMRMKVEVFSHYCRGKIKCLRCGENDLRVLSLDHINGSTKEEKLLRRATGSNLYKHLRRNNYPPGFQVLCMNCQYRKRWDKREFRKMAEKRN